MATVKKTRPVVKKAEPAKPANKKLVNAKPVSKSSVPAPKSSLTKSKTVEKVKPLVIPKKSAPTKSEVKATTPKVISAPIKNNPTSKVPSKTPSKAETALIKKVVSISKVAAKIVTPVKSVTTVKAIAKSTAIPSKQEKHSPVKNTVPAPKSGKAKAIPPVKQDDKLDPLHVKAAKAIKELSETMDLSKVRPRIQAGTPPPPPKIVHRHHSQPLKLVEPTNTSKIKFQIEFEFRASPKILYNYLYDSSGLAGWFADEVKSKDNLYTFIWEGGESNAKLVAFREQHLVRFQWTEETDGTYFQFEIKEDDLTGDVALVITDFANPGERDANARLWESQVQKLRLLLGSF